MVSEDEELGEDFLSHNLHSIDHDGGVGAGVRLDYFTLSIRAYHPLCA